MLTHPYCLVNDGSNDSSIKKMNATCALIFDVNRSKMVEFRFFDVFYDTGELLEGRDVIQCDRCGNAAERSTLG